MSKTLDCLNEAFRRDPVAMYALATNRVPCNQSLADDPFVEVDAIVTLPGGIAVGMLGVLNGVLMANGLPEVELEMQQTLGSPSKIVGFRNRS